MAVMSNCGLPHRQSILYRLWDEDDGVVMVVVVHTNQTQQEFIVVAVLRLFTTL